LGLVVSAAVKNLKYNIITIYIHLVIMPPVAVNTTPFELALAKKFEEKGLSPSTIVLYLKNLKKLNNNQPINDFRFLYHPQKIVELITNYAETTKRNFIIAVVSALNLAGDSAKHKKLYTEYYNMMMTKNKEIKEQGGKSKDDLPSWAIIMQRFNELKVQVEKATDFKKESDYNNLLKLTVLSLYVLQPPRRNGDYLEMMIVPAYHEELPNDHNYLSLKGGEFIFNKYKTSKKYGEYRQPIVPELKTVIQLYLKNHPTLWEGKKQKKTAVPFLVHLDGEPLHQLNSITRIINSVLGKGVGSSALRHIYLTHKYGDVEKEQAEDAKAMAHSVGQQKDYIMK
jgi:hypothetical protein